jgi:hypothetical protein
MNLVHVSLAAQAVAARLWRAGPGQNANPERLRRAGPGRGLAAVARHAGPGQNGPRPGPVGGPERQAFAFFSAEEEEGGGEALRQFFSAHTLKEKDA